MNFKDTHEYLTSRQFNPSKKMGQNFLINPEMSKNIISKINLDNVDLVIEIGPGLGSLTDFLVNQKFDLTLIELDKRLNEFLHKRFKDQKLTIINNDVLKVDFNEITKSYKNPIIISNLPYSISSLVVLKFLKCESINTFHCMLQQEMVDRISADVRTKKYNSFTALMSYYTKIDKTLHIGPNNFLPAPDVDSIFITISKNNKTYDENFDKFLRLCFLNRRKTILNNLKPKYGSQKIQDTLTSFNINLTCRAEELTPDELFELFTQIEK